MTPIVDAYLHEFDWSANKSNPLKSKHRYDASALGLPFEERKGAVPAEEVDNR